jgi:hypothetical protein
MASACIGVGSSRWYNFKYHLLKAERFFGDALCMAIQNLFASKSVTEHLVRGAVGLAAWTLAFRLLATPSTVSLISAALLGLAALVVMRGCPTCWTMGLINTIFRRTPCAACNDLTQRKA